ncbi:MAG: endonuclease MutS2 [Clostridia bacterium]|nr:endonuclease MutS2 [Clostridia bacterium]
MEKKTLKTLEYNKIIDILEGFAVSESAKKMVRELKPFVSIKRVSRALALTDSAYIMLMKYGTPSFYALSPIGEAIKRMDKGGSLSMAELLNCASVLKNAEALKKYGEENSGSLSEIFESIIVHKNVADRITSAVISEEEVSDSASPELYDIRRKIRTTSSKIKDVLNNIIHGEHYRKMLQDNIITMRNDRYVVPVKAEYKGEVGGIVHDISASGGTVFIEPSAVVSANNDLHELAIKEKQEIEKILRSLTNDLIEIEEDLKIDFDAVTELDFIFAKAKMGVDFRGVIPNINTEGRINIIKGRHPLINREKVVPVDINLGIDFDSLIVTGPNTGGKTVVLKTVGLFTLMAQSGLMIPAGDNSEIAVFSNVFADIGDEQSIEQSLSTFSSHMVNIVHILENITPDSLVLFDELGAGTDPTEGAALANAILEYVRGMGAKTVATTHYSELKLYALSTERVENGSCEFDVNTLSPTYRLLIGVPGRSNAFAVSKRLGLSDYIIEKSKELLSKETIKFEDVLSSIEKDRKIAESASQEQTRLKNEVKRLRDELKAERRKFDEERERLMVRASEKAEKIIHKAEMETESALLEIKKAKKEKDEQEALKKMEEMKKELREKLKGTKRPPRPVKQIKSDVTVNNLKPGSTVMIIDMGDKGTVVSINKKDESAVVQVGIMKVTAKLKNLALVKDKDVEELMRFVPRRECLGAKDVRTELDLRGKTLEEALYETDLFLDQCMRSSLHNATIIHGKGTGKLRTGIQNMLRKDKRVKSYRTGTYGEGENGVTLIEL